MVYTRADKIAVANDILLRISLELGIPKYEVDDSWSDSQLDEKLRDLLSIVDLDAFPKHYQTVLDE